MAEKASPNLYGKAWQSKLAHVYYDGKTVRRRNEYINNIDFLQEDGRHFTEPILSHPLYSKFVKVSAFIVDVDMGSAEPFLALFGLKSAKPILKHHIVLLQTESGFSHTIEKGPDCILLQTCDGANADPIILHQIDGAERPMAKSLQRIIADSKPKKGTTILDVLHWINHNNARELREAYHVTNSNCQDFARRAWRKVSHEDYPNAAKFEKNLSSKIQYDSFLIMWQ